MSEIAEGVSEAEGLSWWLLRETHDGYSGKKCFGFLVTLAVLRKPTVAVPTHHTCEGSSVVRCTCHHASPLYLSMCSQKFPSGFLFFINMKVEPPGTQNLGPMRNCIKSFDSFLQYCASGCINRAEENYGVSRIGASLFSPEDMR